LQVIIWMQLVPDPALPVLRAGGEISCELACDGEAEALLRQEGSDGGDDSGYDVVREMEELEAAVVNGRRAQVDALRCYEAVRACYRVDC
jgi:hypothetical protein